MKENKDNKQTEFIFFPCFSTKLNTGKKWYLFILLYSMFVDKITYTTFIVTKV